MTVRDVGEEHRILFERLIRSGAREVCMDKIVFKRMWICLFVIGLISGIAFSANCHALDKMRLSKGQMVYVPVYSNVFIGDRAVPFNLAVMLSLRNTDPRYPITIVSVHYYNNEGKLIRKYLEKSLVLNPLGSNHIFLKERDSTGGFGANFIVHWKSEKEVNAPIFESIMIGTRSEQGISFVSPGRVIQE